MTLKFVGPSQPHRQTAVVMLHGAGANRHDLAPLKEILDREGSHDWYFPEAPICQSQDFNMHIWFPVADIVSMVTNPRSDLNVLESYTPPRIGEARQQLDEFLTGILSKYDRIVLGGFSQGAMMSMDYFVRNPEPKIHGIILLSGTLADKKTWEKISDDAKRPPVFQSHGSSDPVLPERFGRQLLEFLARKNFQVSFHGFEGGHDIPEGLLNPIKAFLKSSLHA
jgi:phospholipase/carboxylesterase